MSKRNLMLVAFGILALLLGVTLFASSPNGSAGQIPAYYDGKLFTINFMELPPGGEQAALTRNSQINFIYQSDQAAAAGFDFISVIDAIPGDGFNPLWNEVQIVFLPTDDPVFFQLFSDDQIAAATDAGLIELVPTDELYRCSVVGKKPK